MIVDESVEEVQEESGPCRQVIAEMYRRIVVCAEDWKAYLDQHQHLLTTEITIEHTPNCSCGRFFEQHPTTIDDTEGEALEKILTQIRAGKCSCLINRDPDSPRNVHSKLATKTFLHTAVSLRSEAIDIVKYLLEIKGLINQQTNLFSYTPLFRATCANNIDTVAALLSQEDIDANVLSRTELHTPLVEAILNRNYPIVNLLLSFPAINFNVRNFRLETPVIVAARMGEVTILEQLLSMGAEVDAREHQGMTALMFAVMQSMKKVIEVLLQYGANVQLRSTHGELPLIMAVSTNGLKVIQMILDAGASIDDVSSDGYTALMVATYSNFVNVVKLLLHYNANVHACNEMGYQAVHIAAWNGYLTILDQLLKAGCVPDVRTNDQNTPLSLAAHGNHFKVVNVLIGHGSNINNEDKDLDTPLHYAAFNGNVQCVEKLLEMGANPGAVNRLQATPLWNAVYRLQYDVVKILVKKNVALSIASRGIEQHAQSDDVVAVFDSPRTPLWVAAYQGAEMTTALLLSAGCDVARETWIAENSFPGESQDQESLKALLRYYHSVPRTLVMQCRIALRRMADSDVRKFIRRLPLPEKCKEYLVLAEF